jgi:hypothetical protein
MMESNINEKGIKRRKFLGIILFIVSLFYIYYVYIKNIDILKRLLLIPLFFSTGILYFQASNKC